MSPTIIHYADSNSCLGCAIGDDIKDAPEIHGSCDFLRGDRTLRPPVDVHVLPPPRMPVLPVPQLRCRRHGLSLRLRDWSPGVRSAKGYGRPAARAGTRTAAGKSVGQVSKPSKTQPKCKSTCECPRCNVDRTRRSKYA